MRSEGDDRGELVIHFGNLHQLSPGTHKEREKEEVQETRGEGISKQTQRGQVNYSWKELEKARTEDCGRIAVVNRLCRTSHDVHKKKKIHATHHHCVAIGVNSLCEDPGHNPTLQNTTEHNPTK